MKTTRKLWFLLMAVLALGLLAIGISLPDSRPAAYAQGRLTPTPPGGRPPLLVVPPASTEEEPGPEEPARNGTVSGIVFNYSASQPQGGIGVVLEGGGWALETVSEADGSYIFQSLGRGQATLNLRLPEDATAVNPDLSVYTGHNLDLNVNLGYYTGDRSPVPVLLTAEYAPVEGVSDRLALSFQVENRGAGDVTGVVVDARMPVGQQIISAQVSQGWADAVGLRAQVHLGNLAKGQKASVNLLIHLTSPEASEKGVRATLTYDQQATSQIVEVVASRAGLPVTGELTAQDAPSSLLLVALMVAAFGCAVVLVGRLRASER
jgi:hypothetical protein